MRLCGVEAVASCRVTGFTVLAAAVAPIRTIRARSLAEIRAVRRRGCVGGECRRLTEPCAGAVP
jgi:hypothetical protein